MATGTRPVLAQSGTRNAIPGGSQNSPQGVGSGRSGSGLGFGGFSPNINGGFSITSIESGRPKTAASVQRDALIAQYRVIAQARLRQNQNSLAIQQQQAIRQRKITELRRRRMARELKNEADRLERIASRSKRTTQRPRKAPIQLSMTQFDRMHGTIMWPAALQHPLFQKQTTAIQKLLAAKPTGSTQIVWPEVQDRLSQVRMTIRDNARPLGSRNYIAARQFVDRLENSIQHDIAGGNLMTDKQLAAM